MEYCGRKKTKIKHRQKQTKPAFQVRHLCSWAHLNPAGGLTSWNGAKASTAEVTLDLRTNVSEEPNFSIRRSQSGKSPKHTISNRRNNINLEIALWSLVYVRL